MIANITRQDNLKISLAPCRRSDAQFKADNSAKRLHLQAIREELDPKSSRMQTFEALIFLTDSKGVGAPSIKTLLKARKDSCSYQTVCSHLKWGVDRGLLTKTPGARRHLPRHKTPSHIYAFTGFKNEQNEGAKKLPDLNTSFMHDRAETALPANDIGGQDNFKSDDLTLKSIHSLNSNTKNTNTYIEPADVCLFSDISDSTGKPIAKEIPLAAPYHSKPPLSRHLSRHLSQRKLEAVTGSHRQDEINRAFLAYGLSPEQQAIMSWITKTDKNTTKAPYLAALLRQIVAGDLSTERAEKALRQQDRASGGQGMTRSTDCKAYDWISRQQDSDIVEAEVARRAKAQGCDVTAGCDYETSLKCHAAQSVIRRQVMKEISLQKLTH